jgi:hypothetical protein
MTPDTPEKRKKKNTRKKNPRPRGRRTQAHPDRERTPSTRPKKAKEKKKKSKSKAKQNPPQKKIKNHAQVPPVCGDPSRAKTKKLKKKKGGVEASARPLRDLGKKTPGCSHKSSEQEMSLSRSQ